MPEPSSPQRLKARSLTIELAFRIQEDILRGALRPGQRLFQEELSERYGVSRTPLREAIQRLEAQGLVQKLTNRAVVVRRLSADELEEVYVVRAELEGFAAAGAAERHEASTMAQLERFQAELTAVVEEASRAPAPAAAAALNERITAANGAFHRAIRAAAGNEYLADMISTAENAFPKDYVWRALRTPDERWALNVDEHMAIRGALERRDAAAAREAMRGHVMHAWTLLRDYLTELGFWDDEDGGPPPSRAAARTAANPASRARATPSGSS